MLISTALLLDSIIRNSVCTPAKLPYRRVEVGYEKIIIHILAKIIHMNLAVKFNLLRDTQPHYIYKPESSLENDNYKLYFDRTVLTDIHIQHNGPDIIILNKQQKQAYLLDIAVPNSHNITQTYNKKINKYLELSVAMRNLWCLEKISILPLIRFYHLSFPQRE
jgi:hypothetical protein